ncbi:MAG TPA: bifunctional serine/threonine-protein kinase/formylglycine-generating enzyme family protein [Pseudomonadota bacterium]|nr:bifunctional serine/threonine-protein kinase/formylglycine-generating enzyme family protein [Pseudomonadota bacterium]
MAATIDSSVQPNSEHPVAGLVLSQRYELVKLIGRGAHGEVWQALDLVNGHLEVAVKILGMERVSQQTRERFIRECSALELLMPHPHIVAIRARGSHLGYEYMVLELIRGQCLGEWLRNYSPKKLPELDVVISIFKQICEGVAAAHLVTNPGPIIHRDIKPENIMITQSQSSDTDQETLTAKVVDFGVARLGARQQTQAGEQLGTPLYMAPEQVIGEDERIGTWSDVYALGVLLFELLTLQSTLSEDLSIRRYVAKHGLRSLGRTLQDIRPDVPAQIRSLMLHALEPKIEARIQHAAQLLQEIRRFERRTMSFSGSSLVFIQEPPERPKWRSAAATLGTGLVVGLTALFFYRQTSMDRQHSVVQPETDGKKSAVVQFHQPASVGPLSQSTHANEQKPSWPPVLTDALGHKHRLIKDGFFLMGSTAAERSGTKRFCQHAGPGEIDPDCSDATWAAEQPQRKVFLSAYYIDENEVTNQAFSQWLNSQHDVMVRQDAPQPEPKHLLLDYRNTVSQYMPQPEPRDLLATRGDVPIVGLLGNPGLRYNGTRFETIAGTEQFPAAFVTWYGAQSFCESRDARLPTEAEWERAARGLTQKIFPWGSNKPRCSEVAIAQGIDMMCESATPRFLAAQAFTSDVSDEAIRQLAGNVSEWVADQYVDKPIPCVAPCRNPVVRSSPETGKPEEDSRLRVVRGGNVWSSLLVGRASSRRSMKAETTSAVLGFRCVQDPDRVIGIRKADSSKAP